MPTVIIGGWRGWLNVNEDVWDNELEGNIDGGRGILRSKLLFICFDRVYEDWRDGNGGIEDKGNKFYTNIISFF